jgi:hypothetical protein
MKRTLKVRTKSAAMRLLSCKVTTALMTQLDEAAARDNRTRTSLVRHLLQRSLAVDGTARGER